MSIPSCFWPRSPKTLQVDIPGSCAYNSAQSSWNLYSSILWNGGSSSRLNPACGGEPELLFCSKWVACVEWLISIARGFWNGNRYLPSQPVRVQSYHLDMRDSSWDPSTCELTLLPILERKPRQAWLDSLIVQRFSLGVRSRLACLFPLPCHRQNFPASLHYLHHRVQETHLF